MSYGCHNAPRPVAGKLLSVQDGHMIDESKSIYDIYGYQNPNAVVRLSVMILIPFVNSTECQYTLTTHDEACAGCKHRFVPPQPKTGDE